MLAWTAFGLCSFAVVVAVDAIRLAGDAPTGPLSHIEAYLAVLPGIAWLTVLLELSRPVDSARSRWGFVAVVAVAAIALVGAGISGGVHPPLRPGHWVMVGAIALSAFGALVLAVRRLRRGASSRKIVPPVVAATLFFGLGNAILLIPLGLLPSWLVLASAAFDVLLLGIAVAWWDAFDEGQALRAGMRRSLVGSMAVSVLFGGQVLIGLAVTGEHLALMVLLFTSLAVAIAINVLADPLSGLLDRLAFAREPNLRADRAALRRTEAALPLRATNPLDHIDDETFVRLTRRALGHYADLSKLVASPLTTLPVIDDRLARRGAPDQPLERANELKDLLADRIAALKPPRRRRLRHHRAVAALQLAVLPVRRRGAGLRAERHGGRTRPGGPAGVAMVRHRGAAAVAAQLAERGGPGDRRRPARYPGLHTDVGRKGR